MEQGLLGLVQGAWETHAIITLRGDDAGADAFPWGRGAGPAGAHVAARGVSAATGWNSKKQTFERES